MKGQLCCTVKALEGKNNKGAKLDYKKEADERFIQEIMLQLELFKAELNEEWLEQLKWNLTVEDANEDKQKKVSTSIEKGIYVFSEYIKNEEDHHLLRGFSIEIANNGLQNNFSVDDIMENVNLTKKKMVHFFLRSTLDKDEQIAIIILINDFFSYATNYCTIQYIAEKENILRDQNKFIQDMHTERLSILGQLSASFVHEFRNPLTAIKGFISLLQETNELNQKNKYYFSVIHHEMRKLQDVCSKFLLLSKSKSTTVEHPLQPFNLSSCVEGVIHFMYPRFSEDNIQVKSQVEDNVFMLGIEEQVEQVILNIIINAAEELKKMDRKREIIVKLSQEQEEIYIQLSNNGPAIPAHILNKIFQPFVTTKEVGTGLGLAVCKQIVEKHKGQIKVASNSEWTSFTIKFLSSQESN